MELSWLTRVKVTAVLVLGVAVWGVFMWHFVAPHDPMGAVTLVEKAVSLWHIAITILVAFCAGVLSYFIAWPYGREVGVLAAPAGLAAWAVRGGDMAELMRIYADTAQRHTLYQSLRWEGIVWFAIAAAGYCGVMVAAKLIPSRGAPVEIHPPATKPKTAVNGLLAFVAAAVIAAVGISMLAKGVLFVDKNLGPVLGQPANSQLAFAAMVAFGLAAFIVKRFWEASYVWPALATVLVSLGAMHFAGRSDVLSYLASNWPANFFAQPVYALLPIQIVSFGCIGSVVGYWLAVRFRYWQTHCAK
jgi:hypothetical protein